MLSLDLLLLELTLNVLLLGTVAFSCASLLLRTLRSRRQQGWRFVSSSILLLCGLSYWLTPAIAGFICAGIWLIFVLVPLLGLRRVNAAVAGDRFGRAQRWARGLAWLHPFDDWREQPRLLAALASGQRGDLAPATQLLSRYRQQRANALAATATVLLYRLEARWSDLQHWTELHIRESKRWRTPSLAAGYLRALGETGNLGALLAGAARCLPQMVQENAPERHFVRLYALAFCGRRQAVDRLLTQSFARQSPLFRQFWQATAAWAAGESTLARRQLERLQGSAPHSAWERAIAWRLQHPPHPIADCLGPEARHLLERIEQEGDLAGAFSLAGDRRGPATAALVGLNLLAFAVEVFAANGSLQPSPGTLVRLGALVPEEVVAGEWWRLVYANFLHIDTLHLGANLLALWFLGPYVERKLGTMRFLAFYLFNGTGALGIYTYLALMRDEGSSILVGASAAIMSLLGGTTVLLWQIWYRERSPLAAKRLRVAIVAIGLQATLDIFVPATSFLGHILGLLLGIAAMGLWVLWPRQRPQHQHR